MGFIARVFADGTNARDQFRRPENTVVGHQNVEGDDVVQRSLEPGGLRHGESRWTLARLGQQRPECARLGFEDEGGPCVSKLRRCTSWIRRVTERRISGRGEW